MSCFFTPVSQKEPLRAAVVLVPEFSLASFSVVVDTMRVANRISGQQLYKTILTSAGQDVVVSSSGVPIEIDAQISCVENVDIVFVVASRNPQKYCFVSLMRWLRARAVVGVGMVGVEAGAFVMGAAGVLNGYRATIHWEHNESFAFMCADVDACQDRFVIDRDRATTAGALPTMDFMLTMIRNQHSLTLAMDVGSHFLHEQESMAHDPQRLVSLGALHWQEPHLARAVELMEKSIENPMPIHEIANKVGLTERSLQRLFKRIVGKTPKGFYLELRLEAARRLLTRTNWPLAEIAVATGFGSSAAFSRAFKTHYKETPGKLRIWRVT